MPALERIIVHWTAGGYLPNSTDRSHYHFLTAWDEVNKKPYTQKGKFKPEDNINCYDGRYAPHCGGGNTGSVGWAICGMLGFLNGLSTGRFPITREQFEFTCSEIAKFCKQNNIPVTPQTILTHYEFGKAHPKTSSAGKIDITYLPPFPQLKADDIGDFIRDKIRWYYLKGGN